MEFGPNLAHRAKQGAALLMAAVALGPMNRMAQANEQAVPDRDTVQFCVDSFVGNPDGIPTNQEDKTALNLSVSAVTSPQQPRLVRTNLHPTSPSDLREILSPDCDNVEIERTASITFRYAGKIIAQAKDFLRPSKDDGRELNGHFSRRFVGGKVLQEVLHYKAVNPQTGISATSKDVLRLTVPTAAK